MVGDFVLKNKDVISELEEDGEEDVIQGEEEEEEKKEEAETSANKKKLPEFSDSVLILDENTVKLYKIEDVVIPLYGNEIQIPQANPIGEIIRELLKTDGITHEDFLNSKQEFFIRGGFRCLIAKPMDVKHDIALYNDKDVDLLAPEYIINEDPKSDPTGKYKAIRIKFSLNKSTYATMCIRELTKTSTSFDTQTMLTKQIKWKDI